MLTDVEGYAKERSVTYYPQRRVHHLNCYDVIPQDHHYQDLLALAGKMRYNRLARFKEFLFSSLLTKN